MMTEEVPLVQLPFIVLADMDDLHLEKDEDRAWFHALRNLPWEDYRELAATYYEQLYAFNAEAAQVRQERRMRDPNPERQEGAASPAGRTPSSCRPGLWKPAPRSAIRCRTSERDGRRSGSENCSGLGMCRSS